MTWIYALELTEFVEAGMLKDDWERNHNAASSLGVTVAGTDATIASTPRSPNFEAFVDEVAYVESVTEYKEIPDPDTSDWSPPYDLHPNGTIEATE